MSAIWDLIVDRWEWDDTFREQIILAIIVGAIGLTFALAEAGLKWRVRGWQ